MEDKIKEIEEWIESNEFLSNLLNNMSSAVFLVDTDVRVINVNRGFKQLFKKSEQEVLNQLCGNAIGCVFPVKEATDCGKTYNCDNCELRKALLSCFQGKEDPESILLKREFFIGREFVEKYFWTTVKYIEHDDLAFSLVMIYDVTELESHRRKLKELNEIKNEFLGMAAHDLRNPIAEISLSSSMLLDYYDKLNDEQKFKFFRMIKNTSGFMLRLVEELLDITAIESGKLVLKRSLHDYIDFVKKNLETNRLVAQEKGIEILLETEKNMLKTYFDPTRIKQVIDNLVSNAIKYSPENTTIIVRITNNENLVRTEVIDEGPGIPDEEVPYLFKGFHKISTKPTAGEKSTGLGLAISKKIINTHNGEIGVSTEVGKGSTFYFQIPIK